MLDHENLKRIHFYEKDRRESFKSWPFEGKSPCNVRKMAEAGFFWTGNKRENDTATCFACGKVLDGWERDDDPWEEHIKHAPQCIFVKFRKPEEELTVRGSFPGSCVLNSNSFSLQVGELLEVLQAVGKQKIINEFEGYKKKVNKHIETSRAQLGNHQ